MSPQEHNGPSARLPWLVADIGGTNARFGWVTSRGGPVEQVKTLPVQAHDGLGAAVRTYLGELSADLGPAMAVPCNAAFAVATVVEGDEIGFTNSHWRFSRAALRVELGLDTLLVLNDFEALALLLPWLRAPQLRAHGPLPTPRGALAVIGPGTGLGVAGVVQGPSGWVAVPGEGGHVTLAPGDEFESRLLEQVRLEFAHVSAERVLSGIGLPVLHGALARVLGQPTEPLPPEVIVERGVSAADPLCSQTIDVFCALLGSFAGNVALTLGARGGVYIGGGIVPRLGERFFASRFRERFEAKGRFRGYLESIPTALITDTMVALSGAALAIEQLGG